MSRLTHSDYMATEPRPSPWHIVPGWNLLACFRDWMHIVYLGTAKDLVASCCKLLLVSRILGNAAPNEQLRSLSHEMYQTCAQAGLRLRRRQLTVANLGLDKPQFAELGAMWKAAQVKGLLYFFAVKMRQVARKVQEGQVVAVCMWSLVRAINIFDGGSLFLSAEDAQKACELIYIHLQSWQLLALRLENLRIFRIRPKHHYLQHLADDLRNSRLNPRCMQCMDDESFLGRVKRMASKCHAASVSVRCLQRYILHLSMRWK